MGSYHHAGLPVAREHLRNEVGHGEGFIAERDDKIQKIWRARQIEGACPLLDTRIIIFRYEMKPAGSSWSVLLSDKIM